MSVDPLDDPPHPDAAGGSSDALTFAFADPAGDVCGVARLGISESGASGLVLIFCDGEPAAVRADSGAPPGERWEDVSVAGLTTAAVEPLRRWRAAFSGDAGFDLEFEAVGDAFELASDSPAGRAGGMQGHDHLCRVTGSVAGRPFEGMGQRGRSWGDPDWRRIALVRTLSAWFDDDHALSAVAVRPAKASSHADEVVAAFVREEDAILAVADPRLSTTYDGQERQRTAGLELYIGDEEEYPTRVAGEAIAGTSVDLGRLRLECAFFRWRSQGREGVGRYDILRRSA